MSQPLKRSAVHRGALNLQEAVIVGIGSLLVLVWVLASGNGLFSRSDYTEELSNAGEIMTNTRGMLKTSGTYLFSSAAAMTGALIQFGGAPGSMAVVGTKSSGTASLINRWGGSTTVGPVSTSGGQNTSFELTYTKVPQEACTQMSQKMSSANNVASTSINGSSTSGTVSASVAAAQCSADSGSSGTNTLVFTSNT
ncbi:prepilin (plasmid) [Pantoea sp. JZ2]|uniref:type 4 pilus major pilin n=1 Tax=Pantoea sp. JZ2 TaxID=2654189 RepID=UPI002B4824C7|nr:type 4 pilus major pilin [Pantoea sp. JZ2]WRH15889.1 prepilin [Pantoea sp. JZ2]